MCNCGCHSCHFRQFKAFYGLGEYAESAEKPRDGLPLDNVGAWIAPGRPAGSVDNMPVRLNTPAPAPPAGSAPAPAPMSVPAPAPAPAINWKLIAAAGVVLYIFTGKGGKRAF